MIEIRDKQMKSTKIILFIIACISVASFSFAQNKTDFSIEKQKQINLLQSESTIAIVNDLAPSDNSSKVGSIGKFFHGLTTDLSNNIHVNIIDSFEVSLARIPLAFTQVASVVSPHLESLSVIIALLLVALAIEYVICYLVVKRSKNGTISTDEDLSDVIAGSIKQILCGLSRLCLYVLLASVLNTIFYGDDGTFTNKAIFHTLLLAICLPRLGNIFSQVILSPTNSNRRFFNLDDNQAKSVVQFCNFIFWLTSVTLFLNVLLKHLGISLDVSKLWIVCSTTLKLVVIAFILICNNWSIKNYFAIKINQSCINSKALLISISSVWLIIALIYLLAVWVLQMTSSYSESTVGVGNGAYYTSIAIIPLYLVLVRILQWSIKLFVPHLHIYQDEKNKGELEKDGLSAADKDAGLINKLQVYVHPFIFVSLAVWLLQRWGYEVPFLAARAGAIFSITITIALTLLCWHFISKAIENKMAADYVEPDVDETSDGEWSSDSVRGRGYTLLPIIRKVTACFLIIGVIISTLSSLGINIAPIIAGAGVLGLAIGFGAQKVVSDILSGFFYLMDDAFRVGEYIEAGTITGCVEKITLRNILLRHHRGMLLIVPFSELGAVTNYMRGGIVVKFNLEFPYDADVDAIRKIIKKVGQAMLVDEEFGADFLQPVKSQGVREITNSVMIIRVKFTAKPGKHFLIRREAYRLITESLNSKGFFYAHKKVIVELPDNVQHDEKVLKEAGAAASQTTETLPLTSPTTVSSALG